MNFKVSVRVVAVYFIAGQSGLCAGLGKRQFQRTGRPAHSEIVSGLGWQLETYGPAVQSFSATNDPTYLLSWSFTTPPTHPEGSPVSLGYHFASTLSPEQPPDVQSKL